MGRRCSTDVQAFRDVIRNSKTIIAIAGAGLSAASGIPTFRDAGGWWRNFDPTTIATPEAFEENPSRVWQFYHMRREKAMKANPNPGHSTLAALCIPDRLRTIAPAASFTLITQNVDGLSGRALQELCPSIAAAPPVLFEMHGRVLHTLCTACNHREPNFQSPICPALAGTEKIVTQTDMEPNIPLEDLPRCRKCTGLLRPDVVWFGEAPYQMDDIEEIVRRADVALVVGTSSAVYPAAGYAADVARNGGKVAVFNLQRSNGDKYADFLFLGPCEETLSSILFGGEIGTVDTTNT